MTTYSLCSGFHNREGRSTGSSCCSWACSNNSSRYSNCVNKSGSSCSFQRTRKGSSHASCSRVPRGSSSTSGSFSDNGHGNSSNSSRRSRTYSRTHRRTDVGSNSTQRRHWTSACSRSSTFVSSSSTCSSRCCNRRGRHVWSSSGSGSKRGSRTWSTSSRSRRSRNKGGSS